MRQSLSRLHTGAIYLFFPAATYQHLLQLTEKSASPRTGRRFYLLILTVCVSETSGSETYSLAAADVIVVASIIAAALFTLEGFATIATHFREK
jgi:hypothetical protein